MPFGLPGQPLLGFPSIGALVAHSASPADVSENYEDAQSLNNFYDELEDYLVKFLLLNRL